VRKTVFFLASLMLAVTASSELQMDLIRQGMDGWADDHGDWVNVGNAAQSDDDEKLLETEPGEGVLVNGPTGKTVNLITEIEHGDVTIHVEFMVPKGSNSGVYLMGRYEVQVLDSFGVENPEYSDCGGLYQSNPDKDGNQFPGVPPRENASRAPGEWQSFDIKFQAPKFDEDGKKIANAKFIEVKHNGVVVHEDVEVSHPTRAAAFLDEKPEGPLMLQGDHGPVAYRNIRVEL
jgi:hypothetical protein